MIRRGSMSPVALGAFILTAFPVGAAGQRPSSAGEIMASAMSNTEGYTVPGSMTIIELFVHPGEFPPGVRDEVFDGLERLALDEIGSVGYQQAVVSLLLDAGSELSNQPMPGVVDRVKHIYEGTDAGVVRLAIIGGMGSVADRHAASAFLSLIAKTRGLEARHAVGSLQRLGAEGEAALRRLHVEGTVVDPWARYVLAKSAERGFRPYREHGENDRN